MMMTRIEKLSTKSKEKKDLKDQIEKVKELAKPSGNPRECINECCIMAGMIAEYIDLKD